jgi:hypothetical protein
MLGATRLPVLSRVPHPGDEAVRRRLQEVYERPEFRPQGDTDWLRKLLEAFFAWLGGLHGTAPLLFWALLVGCLVLLAVILAHLAWTVRRAFAVAGRSRARDAGAAARRRLSLACREEAARRAAAHDYVEAIRLLFLALVYRFDEEGRVSFERAYTNREYLHLFADRPTTHDGLKVFVDTLDDQWYGQRPGEQGQYERCLSLYDRLSRGTA